MPEFQFSHFYKGRERNVQAESKFLKTGANFFFPKNVEKKIGRGISVKFAKLFRDLLR